MSNSRVSDSLESLRGRYAASFTGKRVALALAWDAYVAEGGSDPTERELATQLHRLCGSAPAYGYVKLGEFARTASNLLRDRGGATVSPQRSGDGLAQAVETVLDELERGAADGSANARPAGEHELRILLVDDDPAQARLNAAALAALGGVVRVASGAGQMWEILLTWPCHAVVLDYWLQGETAADIAPQLRREPVFASTAVVCFSTERDPAILRAILDAGCDAVLGKPKGAACLLELVCEQVARSDRSGILFSRGPDTAP